MTYLELALNFAAYVVLGGGAFTVFMLAMLDGFTLRYGRPPAPWLRPVLLTFGWTNVLLMWALVVALALPTDPRALWCFLALAVAWYSACAAWEVRGNRRRAARTA
jgi:hypothetical protein